MDLVSQTSLYIYLFVLVFDISTPVWSTSNIKRITNSDDPTPSTPGLAPGFRGDMYKINMEDNRIQVKVGNV